MSILTAEEVQARLKPLDGWTLAKGEIVREMVFKDFIAAMSFVNKVADQAEATGHHPDIDIRYNKVRLALVSHDAGGVTQKDFDVASTVDRIFRAVSQR